MMAETTQSTVVETTVRGMTVVAAQLPWARSCAGTINIPAGFAEDPPGREGTAHLTEHICVAGALRHERVQLAARTYASAAQYSARATVEATTALVRALTSPFVADPHSDRLHEAETQAVLTENARLRDQPWLNLAAMVAARAFPLLDVALRDNTTTTSIASVTPADVMAFRRTRYRPDASVLCLAGPHDPDALMAEAEPVLASLPSVPPDRSGGRGRRDQVRPFEMTGWSDCLVWATLTPPAATNDDLYARSLATELLVGRAGLLDQVDAAVGTRSTGFATVPGQRSDLLVVAWPDGPLTGRLVAGLRQPVTRFLTGDRGKITMATGRARLRSQLTLEQQSPGGLASLLLSYASGRGPWPDVDDIDAIADERVVGFIETMLNGASLWRIADDRLEEVPGRP